MGKKAPEEGAVERTESLKQTFGALRDQVHWMPNTSPEEVARIIETYIRTGENT